MEEEVKKKKRQQVVRVALTEVLMALSIVCVTIFLVLLTLGYKVDVSGDVERSGLVQINSNPTGAAVIVDGNEEFLARTNLSKAYPAGTHTIALTRDGYGSWEKTISITEGFYYRLSYPRLFLNNIESNDIADIKNVALTSMSPDGSSLFVIENGKTMTRLMKLDEDRVTEKNNDLAGLFAGAEDDGKLTATIKIVEWSGDGNKILIKTTLDAKNEWVLLDTKNMKESVNLTKTFGLEIDDLRLESSSGNKIFVIVNHELRELNVDGGTISKILVSNVEKIENNGEDVVYLTTMDENGCRQVGTYRSGDKGGVNFYEVKGDGSVEIGVGEYFEDDFLAIFDKGRLAVYQGEIPTYEQEEQKMNLTTIKEVGFADAEKFEIRGGGELVFAKSGKNVAVFDAEAFNIVEYELVDENSKWLDNFMLYSTRGGMVEVMDFDGLNKRVIIKEGVKEGSIVTISKSGRWMYYINAENKLVAAKVS